MHNIDLILTLTGGFVAALTFGYITQRIGISPIIGYLLAGIVVSPHTPGFNADPELAEQLAEIGVILLMFGVGLQFHFKELLAVKRIAVPGAIVQSLTATALSAVILHWLGWGWPAGIVFGLAVSVASTVVLIRVLADNGDLHTVTGHISVGWLVMEDLFTIFVLVLLPAIFGAAATGGELALGLGEVSKATGWATLKIGALVAFTFIVGGWVIPRLLTAIAKTGSRELFTLAVLAIALGIAVGSAKVFGVSMALGAFLAGMVVGRSDFSLRAATEALPMRDAFAVLFFVSVGMLFDWSSLLENPLLVIATMVVILIGKPAAALAIVILMRYPLRVALSVSIVLAQIGEFSFILATMSRQLNIIPESATNTLVASAILSITLNPLTYRLIPRIERGTERLFPWFVRWVNRRASGGLAGEAAAAHPVNSDKQRAIVVGYGPVGQIVARLLRENEFDLTIVELNVDTVQRLKAEGVPVVYGDATRIDTLMQAGVPDAKALVLSASSIKDGREVVRQVRELNPDIRILARTAYLRELEALRDVGADGIFSGEGEVALAITEHILRDFGATPEQIDRERERVHRELFPAQKTK
ncbi:sodium:proton exchanger [Cephaloticoccus primus]|uniref:Sodium:proton exchanger n=1 Tax=Cephaloticoccus primus TaxID=1548207 RepID=A0A139SMV9_9BACT|nr:cation:proton antiporter [Cephaloticoccus primus]KXU35946.1 sodium:proton exchanger [Cephaloticoccus primus]